MCVWSNIPLDRTYPGSVATYCWVPQTALDHDDESDEYRWNNTLMDTLRRSFSTPSLCALRLALSTQNATNKRSWWSMPMTLFDGISDNLMRSMYAVLPTMFWQLCFGIIENSNNSDRVINFTTWGCNRLAIWCTALYFTMLFNNNACNTRLHR